MSRRSDSLVTVLALLGFVLATFWLLQRTHIDEEQTYSPLTTYSPKPDGAQALYELLASVGSKPQRFGETEYHYPNNACIVLLESAGMPALFGDVDAKALRLWLERGGTLVLGAPPEDEGFGIVPQLMKELQIDEPTPKDVQAINTPRCEATLAGPGTAGKLTPYSRFDTKGDIYELPSPKPVLFTGVKRIEHAGATPTLIAGVQLLGSDSPVLWYRKVGKGELYWLTRPEMLSNSWLARADNHRLLLNVFDAAAHGRPLYFDEHIHGFARETPNLMALLAHTRGGHLLLTLCGLALLLFAGAAVRPAKFKVEKVPERRQGVEMVLAQADLYERANARHVIADSQIDSLRRAYMERRHLASPPSEKEVLLWVESCWVGDAQRKSVLAEYLRNKLLSRSSHALLELARACDDAKSMLT